MASAGFHHWYHRPPFDSEDLRIRGVGVREPMRRGIVDRPQGTGDVLIMCWHETVSIATRSGRGRHPPGTLVLWRPDDGHWYGSREHRWSHSWIHCSGKRVDGWIKEALIPANTALELGTTAALWEDCLFSLHRELRGPYQPSARIAGNLIENCLLALGRHLRHEQREDDDVPLALREARHVIETRFHTTLRLADLARVAGYSVPRFGALFRQYFGSSPMAYLVQLRLQRATYLLREPDLPIGEIAQRVGYDDPAWFSRLFKQAHGVSPRAWRQALANISS